MLEKVVHKLNNSISFDVEEYTITLHRYEDALSDIEDNKRLISYVDLICMAGKKYLPKLIDEQKNCA